MPDPLVFNPNSYVIKTYEAQDKSITCRAWIGVQYCANPVDPIQRLNIFAPVSMFESSGESGTEPAPYSPKNSPIFMPNTVGGFMPGPADEPGMDMYADQPNSIFQALEHGYVVASAGVRGRTSGMETNEFFEGSKRDKRETGFAPESSADCEQPKLVGRAPAFIVDMKAAIRYLRHNSRMIPGDTERIVTSGTSAGGALSALTGTSGNSEAYGEYLQAIGAADERDDIFAANCYCPIINLEHADMAYEWMFNREKTYHMAHFEMTPEGDIKVIPNTGQLTPEQQKVSEDLKAMFPEYVNALGLKDSDGNPLTLDADGEGNLKEYMEGLVCASAQRELDTAGEPLNQRKFQVPGSKVDEQAFVTIENGHVTGIDWDGYVSAITRMKSAPAFDALDLKSPECEEFGTDTIFARHFTQYSQDHSTEPAKAAPENLVKLINPLTFIGSDGCTKHFRIRHGAYDRDTANVIPAIFAVLLENAGYDVDFALPWGLPHCGDYDLEDVFAWIDGLCS